MRKVCKKGGSCTPYTHQGSLQCILAQYPTTAGSAQFCLLCCQPEPDPGSLTARVPQLTPWDPCRLPAWLGVGHQHATQDILSSGTLHHPAPRQQERRSPSEKKELLEGTTRASFCFPSGARRRCRSWRPVALLERAKDQQWRLPRSHVQIPFGDHPLKLERYRED